MPTRRRQRYADSRPGLILFRPSYYWYTTPDFSGVSRQHWCQEVET